MRSAPRDPRPRPLPARAPRTSRASSGAPGDCRNSRRSKRSRARARSRNRRKRRNRTPFRPSAWAASSGGSRSRAGRRSSRAASRGLPRPRPRGCAARAPWPERALSPPRRRRRRSCARPCRGLSFRRGLALPRLLFPRGGAGHFRVVPPAPVGPLGDAEEIELDGEAVRILDEELVELRLGEIPRPEGNADRLKMLQEFFRIGGEDVDVVDRAGIVLRRVLRAAEVVERGVRHAALSHVHLDLAVNAQPVAGKRKVGARHDLEPEHPAVEILGALELVRADEKVVEFGDGHGVLLVYGALCQRTKYTLRSPGKAIRRHERGQDDRTDRRRRPQALSLPLGTQGKAARGLDRGAGNFRGQQPYQEHRRRLRGRRLSRHRAGVLRPRAARRGPRLFAGGHRSRPHLHPEDELGQRDQGRGRRKGRAEGRGKGRHRRLLLGRDGVVDGGGAPRRPGVRRVLLRRRHPEQRRRKTEVPGDVPLGRDRPVDPDRRREEGRGAAPERAVLHLSGRPRLQLRPARLVPRRERQARALAHARVPAQAYRVDSPQRRNTMSSIQVRKLADALGAEVSGVDLSRPLAAGTFAEIRKAWLDHLVLRFRGQTLSDPQLMAFSQLFGELDPPGPNPYGKPFLPEHPEMNVISNIKMEGAPIGGLGDGEAIWHADMTYVESPPMAAILHALEVPPSGGDTYWANMYLAYQKLPANLKERIEGRKAVHDATYNSAGRMRQGYQEVTDPRKAPGAQHALVRTHPETGRPCLFLGRRRNSCIVGMELDESEALLDQLWAHATQAEFTFRQQWKVGDVLIWDNRCTLHRRDSFDANARRLMHRTQIKADRPRV